MVQTFKEVEKIVEKYSETELTDWYYDGVCGSITIEGNPYEGQIWSILPELRYIDNIKKIELKLSENAENDNDTLYVEFTEIYKAEEHVEYYQEQLRIKNKIIERLSNEIEELKKINKEMV